MRRALRHLGLLALGMLAALTGCSPPVITPLYGPPPVEHDPSIEFADFSYQPASPIRIGDTLQFRATTSKPFSGYEGEIRVVIGDEQLAPLIGSDAPTVNVLLNDHGLEADEVEGDGVWTGELVWLAEYGPQQDLPVEAHLHWLDGYVTAPVLGAPLTVLPAEDPAS